MAAALDTSLACALLVSISRTGLQRTRPFEFTVDYGERAEHCWNGDQENGNHISRLRYYTMYLDKMMARIEAASPTGADTTSWRY